MQPPRGCMTGAEEKKMSSSSPSQNLHKMIAKSSVAKSAFVDLLSSRRSVLVVLELVGSRMHVEIEARHDLASVDHVVALHRLVPDLDVVTLLEEDKVMGFFGGGRGGR